MRINCKHLVKEDNGCGINRGWGWRGEYCGIAHLGKDCDHQEAVMKVPSWEQIMAGTKEVERRHKAVLAKRGRDQFKKKNR